MSVRRFKVLARLDGASELMITITPTAGGTDAVMTVRPKHKRKKYSGLLSWAALALANHDAKLTAQSRGVNVPAPRKNTRAEAAAERRRNRLYPDER